MSTHPVCMDMGWLCCLMRAQVVLRAIDLLVRTGQETNVLRLGFRTV
jgi:hypothetical protein